MTPLYIKTDNSLLSSLIKIDDLIEFAVKNNIHSLGLTDDNMYGVIEFYSKCIKNNIKPIIGLNIYDVYLYAQNYEGYKNLLKLTTTNSKEEINESILKEYSSDLICVVPYKYINKFDSLKNVFKYIFKGYTNLDERMSLKGELIYCNNILCLEKKDTEYLKYLYKIKSQEYQGHDNYMFDYKLYEMDSNNNNFIVENCNVILPMHQDLMPKYDCPNNMDSYQYLKELVKDGLKSLFNQKVPISYVNRVKYELEVINNMGFCNYFLIVWDYVKYAKTHDILVGPGRGSAAGSLVAYLLNITTIDPIKYDLIFERFLNKDRITMPDIDIDFEYTKRDEVLKYCINKYGSKKVAPIITFGTLGSKQVIRDVGKILNVDIKVIDYLAKLLDSRKTLKENYENKQIKEYLDKFSELKNVYKISLKLEGLKRHTSIHAAGIVISSVDIDEVIPLDYHGDFYTTGYSMEYLETIGLLKMDLLALKNLTLINDCLNEINISFDSIPLNDSAAISIFTNANTIGIFQFESSGMMDFIKKFKPNSFDDITACIALYRPGPMQYIDSYIKRKNGSESIDYIDPSIESILKPTYGIIVYQEQIMMIASKLAHYSLAQADILRKAMSKKNEEVLIQERDKFVNGCDDKVIGSKVYEMILKFASYGFNKAHSVSYAMIAYKMAYIKAHYPNVFMKHLLSMVIGSEIKTKDYISECKKNNINVIKPMINTSDCDYKIVNNSIVYPLTNIKSIGNSIASAIIEERKKSKFVDIFDFITRCDVGIKTLEVLIKADTFREFDINQKTLDNNIDLIMNYSSLGSLISDDLKPVLTNYEEYDSKELLARELTVFGFYLSNHPVLEYKNDKTINLSEVNLYFNKNVSVIIYVEKFRKIVTKKGDDMTFITGSDETGTCELVLFPKKQMEISNSIYSVKGRVEKRFDSFQIIIEEMEVLE